MKTYDIDYETIRNDRHANILVTVEIEDPSEDCPGSVAIHACDKDGGDIDLTDDEEEAIMERVQRESEERE